MKTLIHSLLVLLLVYSTASAQYQWWEEQKSGTIYNIWANSAVDDNVCWMGAEGGVVLRTTDGGTNWTNVGGGAIGTNAVYNLFAWDANLALCTTTPSTTTFVYRTTNGGTTWTQVFTQTNGFIDNIWLTSETNGFMQGDPVGSRWSIWKTTDGGATWDSTGLYLAQVGTEWGYLNSMYVNGSKIYFGTNNNRERGVRARRAAPSPASLTSHVFSTRRACPSCARSFAELDPRLFSFNSRHGWCQECIGTGLRLRGFDAEQSGEEAWWSESADDSQTCTACAGQRLNAIALHVRFHERSIAQMTAQSVTATRAMFAQLGLEGRAVTIARDVLAEINSRLAFLEEVGLGYLALDRSAPTLSGGERGGAQRPYLPGRSAGQPRAALPA